MTRSTTTRRQALPRDWSRRREVTRRLADGQCEQRDGGVRCVVAGVDAGHLDPLGGDDPIDLMWLCREHLEVKAYGQVQVEQAGQTVVAELPVAVMG